MRALRFDSPKVAWYRPVVPLDKVYDPHRVERRWYDEWLQRDLFRADPRDSEPPASKPPFSMVIPPPNITGSLHMGHALNNTLQDVLCRWRRMTGDNVLWVPGTDHAGIATQNVVERQLTAEGIDRQTLGREAFVERTWQWRDSSGGTIIMQLKRLGVSCDWSRERFTMDEGLSRAVREVFVRLYEEGLIYRDRYLINWCPRCRTALSVLEVEHTDTDGKLYHLRYPLADGSGAVEVVTTRPETMLGDTAVAVHPDDERYRGLVGRTVRLPAIGREIPIIADEYVDREFGSGAVKITPAHDFNDFEIGLRHKLPMVSVMDEGAVMTAEAGPYAGLDRYVARERLVADFERDGVLVRTEPHTLALGRCYRCHTPVEPHLSVQWFVRIAPLAAPAIAAVRDGRTRFVPTHWEKTYFSWMENIHDWCISRQLWWGHRIPAWYCAKNGHTIVRREDPKTCPQCGDENLRQDPDVLDTWFSSGLWPFSTLGWPEKTRDLETWYPTSVLVTGFDIIFFWVARMMMMGLKFMGDVPFREVYIHALVRDQHGQKMSKSKGNVVDPLAVMDTYGTDAFRFALVAFAAMGRDIKLAEDRIEGYRNFMNKIWNAARFVMMQLESGPTEAVRPVEELTSADYAALGVADQWILARLVAATAEIHEALGQYRFNDAASRLYEFAWHEFCDWYLEMSKITLAGGGAAAAATRANLVRVLEALMRLLHPFTPFITEEIRQALPGARDDDSIVVARYPRAELPWRDGASTQLMASVEQRVARLIGVVRAIRNIRAEMNLPPGRALDAALVIADPEARASVEADEAILRTLARVSGLQYLPAGQGLRGAATALVDGVQVLVPLAGLVDLDEEIRRLTREIGKVAGELSGVEKKLGNPSFRERAPEEIVAEQEEKAAGLASKKATLERSLRTLEEARAG
ncbi:MAG: valine--tRNA ligase [Deltaproteobacteria bacterium]|nr:MAG: valine--tRNA ligase [Deltaproteobacteria bacterium]